MLISNFYTMAIVILKTYKLHIILKIYILFTLTTFLQADTGTLTKIVDSDTLHFKTNGKKVKCRIEYIDTPEFRRGKKINKDLKACNYMVKEKDLLSAGKSATRVAKRLLKINSEYEYTVDHDKKQSCHLNLICLYKKTTC